MVRERWSSNLLTPQIRLSHRIEPLSNKTTGQWNDFLPGQCNKTSSNEDRTKPKVSKQLCILGGIVLSMQIIPCVNPTGFTSYCMLLENYITLQNNNLKKFNSSADFLTVVSSLVKTRYKQSGHRNVKGNIIDLNLAISQCFIRSIM